MTAISPTPLPFGSTKLRGCWACRCRPTKLIATLDHLGFGVTTDSPPDTLQVTVPSWRVGEVTREADLVEEVIRIVGYDHVPATLPAKSAAPESSFRAKTLSQLHQVMRASGLTEVVTNSSDW
jgi:phenylalanyl-tRNA synthetase beta chain